MKIYVDGIIYSLQKGGGISRYTDEIINGLVKEGYEVNLLIHKKTCNRNTWDPNIKIIEIKSPFRTKNKIIRILTYPLHKHRVSMYFEKNKINNGIFHSTYFTYYKKIKIPKILNIYDLTREKFPKYFSKINNTIFLYLNKKAILNSDIIICISKQTENDLISYYKTNNKKILVTYLGVNKNFIIKTKEQKTSFKLTKGLDNPYILFVGRRSGYKNFEKFIKAFSLWSKNNNFNIITIGGGDFNNNEKILIKKLKIENKIKNFKFVNEEDLIMFYNCANSFIFPSLSEGFGLPILEAAACGTPILASDIPVFKEIANDIPYYFNPKDTNSIIKTLDEQINTDSNKIKNGILLAENYTWEKTIKETINIYKKIQKDSSSS